MVAEIINNSYDTSPAVLQKEKAGENMKRREGRSASVSWIILCHQLRSLASSDFWSIKFEEHFCWTWPDWISQVCFWEVRPRFSRNRLSTKLSASQGHRNTLFTHSLNFSCWNDVYTAQWPLPAVWDHSPLKGTVEHCSEFDVSFLCLNCILR